MVESWCDELNPIKSNWTAMAWMLCLIFWIKSELKTSRTIIRRLLLLYLLICSKVKNPLEQPHKMSLIHWTRIQLADSYARHGPLSHLTGQNWQSEDIRRKFRTKKMTIFKNNQIFDDWISHTVHWPGSQFLLSLSLSPWQCWQECSTAISMFAFGKISIIFAGPCQPVMYSLARCK